MTSDSNTSSHEHDGADDPTEANTNNQTQGDAVREGELESGVLTQILNKATPGLLRLAFTSRDVTIEVDGDLALRLVTVFRRGRGDGLDDMLNPMETSALAGWLALDLSQVMLVEWQPGPDAHEAVVRQVRTRLGDTGRTKG